MAGQEGVGAERQRRGLWNLFSQGGAELIPLDLALPVSSAYCSSFAVILNESPRKGFRMDVWQYFTYMRLTRPPPCHSTFPTAGRIAGGIED